MSVVTLKSTIFPTAEMASSSLDGSMIELGKGQEMKVLGIDVVEIDGGFMAVANIEVTNLEVEDPEEQQTPTEKQELDSGREESNDGYYVSDLSRGSIAEDSFPDLPAPPSPEEGISTTGDETDSGDSDTGGRANNDIVSSFDERIPETPVESENIMVPQEERIEAAHLSEEMKNDFAEAQQEDNDFLIAAAATPESALNADAQEERDERLRKKRLLAEAQAASEPGLELTE